MDYILFQLDAIEYFGYNKLGANTLPNLVPMITGWPWDKNGPYVKAKRIWREFAEKGFWTSFGEDWDLSRWALDTKGQRCSYSFNF